MPLPPKTGPLTAAELEELWLSVVDGNYAAPFVAGGDGRGFEVHRQSFEQHARVSLAIDRSTQAVFILPWSGQTSEPASGAALSTVTISVSRAVDFDRELTFTTGLTLFEEETTDAGRDGPVEVTTGLRYRVLEQRSLGPGEAGPLLIPCVAERPGRGYDNPEPASLSRFVQPGAGYSNSGASVVPGTLAVHRLVVANRPDVVTPDHVGQYLLFTAGANQGERRRVVGYEAPNPPAHGGVALLAATGIFRFSMTAGTYRIGEAVEGSVSGATGRFVHLVAGTSRIVVDRSTGTFAVGDTIIGLETGAIAVVDAVEQDPALTAETATAAWYVLDWERDLELTATNDASPTGGRAAVLDEVGAERRVLRSAGEDDTSYRLRVSTPSDVVSPKAILRRANRVLAPFGATAVLREVGLERLRGLLFDVDPTTPQPEVAYVADLDFVGFVGGVAVGTFFEGELVEQNNGGVIATGRAIMTYPAVAAVGDPLPALVLAGVADVRGTFVAGLPVVGSVSGATLTPVAVTGGLDERDRYKFALDYTEFRAFFLLGLPPGGLGDFGVALDAHPFGAFDIPPYLAFFDGLPATTAVLQRSVWQTVDEGRAGGVGFDLVQDRTGV